MFLPLSCLHVPKERPQPSTFLPGPRTGLSSRLLQLRKLLWKEEETSAVAGGACSSPGGFLWACLGSAVYVGPRLLWDL